MLQPMEPKLLTVMEAAKELRVCRASIYKLLRSGALPSVLVLDRRMVRRDDLDAFVSGLPPVPVRTPRWRAAAGSVPVEVRAKA